MLVEKATLEMLLPYAYGVLEQENPRGPVANQCVQGLGLGHRVQRRKRNLEHLFYLTNFQEQEYHYSIVPQMLFQAKLHGEQHQCLH